ncbi:carboxylesterase family protein [Erythrobacter litoralis]|uniref:carboxylesterase/lipase family protein n=1 Tax=Erythrobacter litoralis TaxID=39960 RepID=UPI002434BCBE|nr:carboxylesterase family protein [Erythrobacter litoralis]MDG6078077.1 carboxylesterase family protein [Erythrobacter litoralis]
MTILKASLLTAALVAVTGCASLPSPSPNGPLAEAPAGAFRGIRDGGVRIWRGIRYAEAPTGDLRWKPPVAMADAIGEVTATQFGDACVQPEARADLTKIYFDDPGPLSEDCLSLNVWSQEGIGNAPVLVWIHGGALVSGSSSLGMYNGAHLARKGAVVVSINYRLGVLGFLAHPALSAESPDGVSGNYGLLDQVAALRWVQRNIAAFGGDPGNVTIAGESAGGLSVMYLLASPEARGLFDKAIAQSAYMVSVPGLSETLNGQPPAEAVGMAVQQAVGAADLRAMRILPAEELVANAPSAGFYPQATVDGNVLPHQITDIFDEGQQAAVPLLVGFNDGETRSLRSLVPPVPKSTDEYENAIERVYGSEATRFLKLYPASDLQESILAAPRDALYGWTAQRMAEAQRRVGSTAYFYLFDHGYPAADQAGLHAFHASEIPYMFGTIHETAPAWPAIPQTADERAFSDAMMSYWLSFARTGIPRAEGGPDWPTFDESKRYMLFADVPAVARDPLGDRFALYEETVCRRRADGSVPWNWNVGIAAPPMSPAKEQCR